MDLIAEYDLPNVPVEELNNKPPRIEWYQHRNNESVVIQVHDKSEVFYVEKGIYSPTFGYEDMKVNFGYQLTEEEAMNLIRENTPKPEPVESPDDWVVQDRVPARALVDQGWFEYDRYKGEVSKGFWIVRGADVGRNHGDRVDVSGEMATVEIRCRRKDLPSPSSPKKIPVRLWVSHRMTHETGADYPVRCGDQPPSGQGRWVEIHHSPDGFYLMADQ
jgi:hypothetical protein